MFTELFHKILGVSGHKWIITIILLWAFSNIHENREDHIINDRNPSPTSTVVDMGNLFFF